MKSELMHHTVYRTFFPYLCDETGYYLSQTSKYGIAHQNCKMLALTLGQAIGFGLAGKTWVLKGTLQKRFSGFFPLRGYPPPPLTPLTENHFAKKTLAERGGNPPP